MTISELFSQDMAQLPVPATHLGLVVVIPCFNEPDILTTLDALAACQPVSVAIEVYLIVNASSQDAPAIHERNQKTLIAVSTWLEQQSDLPFQLFSFYFPELPAKHAGVGLARRLGMDLAAERLFFVGKPDGVIVNLDADCTVKANYFQALEQHFQDFPKTPGASLAFEHPLSGAHAAEVYAGIVYYELFLRYYVHAQRFAGFPFAFQTIGSAMAVRAAIYRKQGGMNRRKAGEDFYFLQKIIELGDFTELNSTRVYPSPRVSDRVPFGTGKAIADWLLLKEGDTYPSYAFQTFVDFRLMVQGLDGLYPFSDKALNLWLNTLSEPLRNYLRTEDVSEKLSEIERNSASLETFRKRFFQWFNAFRTMKSVHDLRDQAYGEQDLCSEAAQLLEAAYQIQVLSLDPGELLRIFRELDDHRVRPDL